MSQPHDPSRATIRILPEDLADARVDAALAAAQSFGMATARPPPLPDAKTGLWYRPWFAVMLAGGLGAFVAWLAFEPFFDDFDTVRGNLTDVQRMSADNAEYLRLTVSGTPVWVSPDSVAVHLDGVTGDSAGLTVGQVVEVRGTMLQDETGILGLAVDVDTRDDKTYAPLDLRALKARDAGVNLAIFPLVAAFVGLFVGAADGIVSRAAHRALTCGAVGLGSGLIGGALMGVIANLFFGFASELIPMVDSGPRDHLSTAAFLLQVLIRGIAWSIAGVAMGLGQGIALQSRRLLLNGLIGGLIGGLVGGLLFDPIDLGLRGSLAVASEAWLSRGVGFTVIGLSVGFTIGMVEILAREAWVKLLTGPLAGKEFVLYRNPTRIGSSPKSDVYLFKDADVEPAHALVHAVGEEWEIEDEGSASGTWVDGRRVRRHRLRPGDQIRIGKTVFAYHTKTEQT